jgi:hypothetical protein
MSFGIIVRGKNSKPSNYRLTSKDCSKYFGGLEDHSYKHYNKALGCMVNGKEDFIDKMQRGGFVPFEMGERMAEEHRKSSVKSYDKINDKTMRVISDLKSTTGKNGKLSSLTGTKRAMEKVGVRFDNFYDKLPSHYQDIKVGGFE